MSEEREQTYGEQAVGLSFNPSGMGNVHELKTLYAKIIDHMDDFRKGYIARGDNPEMVRLCSIALEALTRVQGVEDEFGAVKALLNDKIGELYKESRPKPKSNLPDDDIPF